MSQQFLGQIDIFSFTFAPQGWAQCNGQLMSIAQNNALYALLGTTYGGDGVSTFGLPNLQGRAPIGFSNNYPLGETLGEANHTLLITEIPSHNHYVSASSASGTVASPFNAYPAVTTAAPYVSSLSGPVDFPTALTGSSQSHSNQSPLLVLNFCIATVGIFPSRN